MLEPGTRQVYLEALRPPDGFQLDRAIGTTYSLDLLALLVAPVAFALFDYESWEDALREPTALLEALRRNAERITLFCQQGQIHVPRMAHFLYAELEDMVVETRAPGGGVFHPKTWTLRYVDADGGVLYRFLCLSRNLTFDPSWDLVFAVEGLLDGEADHDMRQDADRGTDRGTDRGAYYRTDLGPVRDFVAALPGMAAAQPVASRVTEAVSLLVEEVPRVAFSLPNNAPFKPSSLRFHPLGIDGHRDWPFERDADRVLVVSPFLSPGPLRLLTETGTRHVLVSRSDAIDVLPPTTRDRFYECLILDDAAGEDAEAVEAAEPETGADVAAEPETGVGVATEPETGADVATEPETGAGVATESALADPGAIRPVQADAGPLTEDESALAAANGAEDNRGLHAKLFVVERQGVAHVYVGSANATAAALLRDGADRAAGNVEFLVHVAGPVRQTGIDAILRESTSGTGLRDVLRAWRPPETDEPANEAEAELDERLRIAADAIARSGLRLRAEETADDTFDLVLFVPSLPADFEVLDDLRCWPVTLPETQARRFDLRGADRQVRFANLTTVGLSRFIAFDLALRSGAVRRRLRFVLNLPLEGAPDNRDARILQHVLCDRNRFVRYLLMLLAESQAPGEHAMVFDAHGRQGRGGADPATALGIPLLEELVRALARHPERIARVKRVVDDLKRTPEGRGVLPDGFDDVWRPIEARWRARNDT